VRTAWPTVHGAAPVFDVRLLVAVRLAFLHLGNGGNRLESQRVLALLLDFLSVIARFVDIDSQLLRSVNQLGVVQK
jgi:hypothetical protein